MLVGIIKGLKIKLITIKWINLKSLKINYLILTKKIYLKKICEELENLFKEDENFNDIKMKNYSSNILLKGKDLFDIIKAQSYLIYCLKKDFINKDLLNKCKQLKYDISNFRYIKYELNSISETRKSQKKFLEN